MQRFVKVILLVSLCWMQIFVGATPGNAKEILTHPVNDVEEALGSGYSYGVKILDLEGNVTSSLESVQLQNGVILTFTNLTDKSLKMRMLMLSNGQPQRFGVSKEESYEYSYEIDARSTVEFPVSADPKNGYPSSYSEFLFILNTDIVPNEINDDVCFYTFSHPFYIKDNINDDLEQPIEPATREMTAEEFEESGDSFYSVAAFVMGQQTIPEKLRHLYGEEASCIRVRSSGPAGVYARMLFLNDELVFRNGKACELFILEENQILNENTA